MRDTARCDAPISSTYRAPSKPPPKPAYSYRSAVKRLYCLHASLTWPHTMIAPEKGRQSERYLEGDRGQR